MCRAVGFRVFNVENTTAQQQMGPKEFELIYQVMAEDSSWLDTYQSRLLEIPSKAHKRVEMIVEDGDLGQTSLGDLDDEHFCATSKPHCTPFDPSSIIEKLPAPEFVHGNRSCVASETYNLFKRAAFATRKSISSKKARTPSRRMLRFCLT